MARSGLSKSEIKEARDLLLSQGRHPSVDAIRVALGNTGSKSTIHRYLKELENADGKANDRQAETARTLHDLVEQMAAKLHADTDARIEAMQVVHELALREKAEEIEALQERIDMLSARLQEVEATAHYMHSTEDLYPENSRQESGKQFGAGFFNTLFNTSRNGIQDQSSALFNASRSGVRGQSLFSAFLNSSASGIVVSGEIEPTVA